jgi:hypothetical protein
MPVIQQFVVRKHFFILCMLHRLISNWYRIHTQVSVLVLLYCFTSTVRLLPLCLSVCLSQILKHFFVVCMLSVSWPTWSNLRRQYLYFCNALLVQKHKYWHLSPHHPLPRVHAARTWRTKISVRQQQVACAEALCLMPYAWTKVSVCQQQVACAEAFCIMPYAWHLTNKSLRVSAASLIASDMQDRAPIYIICLYIYIYIYIYI